MAGAFPTETVQRPAAWSAGTLVELLRLGRLHSAALTLATVLVPYYLAVGAFDTRAWWWVLWVFAVHYAGLATNNLVDAAYDKDDPNKQMLPTVSGALSMRTAWLANLAAHVVAVGLPLALAPTPVVAGWTLAGLAGGWAYCLTSKIHPWSLLWHHVCVAGLVLVPFFAYTSTITPALLAWLAIIELILTFMLMVEGPSKDVGQRQMPYDWSKLTRATKLGIGMSLRVASVAASAWLLVSLKPTAGLLDLVPVALLALITLAVAVPALVRPADLKLFGVNEVAVYAMGIVALLPAAGAGWVAVLIFVPLLWYVGYNRVVWGRWGAPKI